MATVRVMLPAGNLAEWLVAANDYELERIATVPGYLEGWERHTAGCWARRAFEPIVPRQVDRSADQARRAAIARRYGR